MDTFPVLSLIALISLLFNLAFRAASTRIFRWHKSTVNKSSALPKHDVNVNRLPNVFIPNMLAGWPWSRRLNPHYAALKEDSATFLQPYGPKAQKVADDGKFAFLTCLTYPTASKERVRTGCDLVNFLFLADDCVEVSTTSDVRKQRDIILDAFLNPHTPRPKGEWIYGEMARQFWENNMQNATETSSRRLFEAMDEYLEGVVQQSIDRGQHRILDVESHIKERRRTSGTIPCLLINQLGFDIPDDVISHPVLQEMTLAAVDIIAIFNDMVSYNVEQMRGDELHNIITCVMNEHCTDVNGAMMWVENHLHGLEQKFLAAMASLPQWEEPLNSQVKEYCNGMGHWVRGNHDWSFESGRYFGSKGVEIKENNWMSLLPKITIGGDIGPVKLDGSML